MLTWCLKNVSIISLKQYLYKFKKHLNCKLRNIYHLLVFSINIWMSIFLTTSSALPINLIIILLAWLDFLAQHLLTLTQRFNFPYLRSQLDSHFLFCQIQIPSPWFSLWAMTLLHHLKLYLHGLKESAECPCISPRTGECWDFPRSFWSMAP